MPISRERIPFASFVFYALTAALTLAFPALAIAQSGDSCFSPPISRLPGTSDRRAVEGDYLVIEYNESTRRAFWYDYRDHFLERAFISRDKGRLPQYGTFLPVVDTKEKIAVHVCGLHFGDQLTVTNNSLVAPEGGADIRGVTTSNQVPNLALTLDALQNPSVTGTTITGGNLGYSTTTALSSTATAVTGVTPGKFSTRQSDGTVTYTDGSITASGKEIAQLMYATYMNAQSLILSVRQFKLHSNVDPYGCAKVNWDDQAVPDPRFNAPSNAPPGSIDGIQKEMHLLAVCELGHQASVKDDATAFDEDVNSTQLLAADITALSNSIAAQGFGARAVAIQNNYAILKGILDLSGYKGYKKATNTRAALPACNLPAENKTTTTKTETKKTTAATVTTTITTSTTTVTYPTGVTKLDQPSKKKLDPIPAAAAVCDPGEKQTFDNFNNNYSKELKRLTDGTKPNLLPGNVALQPADIDKYNPSDTFEEIALLAADLKTIDNTAANIFNTMNDWYRSSQLEQTDLITPATANYLMRVSIVVQRGYTPFTLASAPTATGPATAAAAAAPLAATTSSSTAATTGTPAHAVETVLVEVHRVANFNLAGGAVVLHVPTYSYAVVPATVPSTASSTSNTGYAGTCGGGAVSPIPGNTVYTSAPAYSCVVQTQSSPWQVAAMAGIVWYPWRHDYFPRHSGFSNFRQNYYPSLLVATSVNTLGDALGAVNFEPITGIDFFVGVGSANSTRLPSGVSLITPVSSSYTFTGVTNVHTGISLGVALDLGVFNQLFTKPQSASLP